MFPLSPPPHRRGFDCECPLDGAEGSASCLHPQAPESMGFWSRPVLPFTFLWIFLPAAAVAAAAAFLSSSLFVD